MTFAFKGPDGWIEIAGEVVLPGFGEPGAGGHRDDTRITPAFVDSLSPQDRTARGLVEIIESASVVDIAGAPHRQYQTAALSSPALEAAVQARRDAIDAYATTRIAVLGPPWKQLDLMCQAIGLLDAAQAGQLTADQVAARASLRTTLAWINAVRAHAETLKGQLPATGPELAAFDITVGWPNA